MKKLLVLICAGILGLTALTGCGKEKENPDNKKEPAVKVNLEELTDKVKEAYGEAYAPDMQYDEATLDDMFGLSKDMYEEIVAEGPMISNSCDVFVGVKAAKGKAEGVEKALTDYKEYLVKDSMQYPTNKIKVQASQIVRYEDYVFFVLLGEISMETEEKGDDAILEEAKAQIKIATDIIDGYFK